MGEVAGTPRVIRFGVFEVDLRSGELRKNGVKIKLQEQPFQILAMLLERPGEVVTREELQRRLWSADTFVDFEHSLATAVKKLREALGDSADNPRFVETLPKRGYRFIAPVDVGAGLVPAPAEPAPPADLLGQTVSRFRIVERLGGGGMGVVYRAEDTKLGRQVAIKFLPAELAGNRRALERFEREARAASALDHPNICTLHDIGEHAGQPFLVMPLLKGQTLKQRLAVAAGLSRQGGDVQSPLPADEMLDLALQIADGLATAHARGIIHRDIKPANVFVTESGQAKILDFGLAKLLHERAAETSESQSPDLVTPSPAAAGSTHDSITRTGVAVGTPAYMSPEQVRREELDARSDLFSFGALLYEMATGQQPFTGDTPAEVQEAIRTQPPVTVRELSPALPQRLEAIIAKALEKDREKRYQSAADLRADLLAVAPIYDRRSGAAITDRRYSRRLRVALGAGVAVILLGLAAYWPTRPLPPPRVTNAVRIARLHGGTWFAPLLTDGVRLYFTDWVGDRSMVMQVPLTGGDAVPFQTPFRYSAVTDISLKRSELLVMGGDSWDSERMPLWVMPLLGGSPRLVGDIMGGGQWSPDGQKILYAKGSDFYVAKSDGAESRRLVSAPGVPYMGNWSPDGTTIRFNAADPKSGADSVLFEMSADGTNLHRLLPGWSKPPGGESGGIWTPDGKYFVFSAWGSSVRTDLWAIRERSAFLRRIPRGPLPLTTGPVTYVAPLPSPDSKKLFAMGLISRGELVRYEARTQEFVPYLGGISASDVDFSRDGQWVAYVAWPDGTLWRSRVDGSERAQLTFSPLRVDGPRWSPDGKRIAFMGRLPGKLDKIQWISFEGGTTQRPIPGEGEERDPQWSPDGNQLLFVRPTAAEGVALPLHVLDMRTNQISIVPGSEGLEWPYWSRDGRYLVAMKDRERRLVLFDLATNQQVELATSRGGFAWPNWSRDEKWVYLWKDFTEGHKGIYRIRLADQKMELVVNDKEVGRTWGVSGQWLGLAPDDSPLVMRDMSLTEIYAFDWEAP